MRAHLKASGQDGAVCFYICMSFAILRLLHGISHAKQTKFHFLTAFCSQTRVTGIYTDITDANKDVYFCTFSHVSKHFDNFANWGTISVSRECYASLMFKPVKNVFVCTLIFLPISFIVTIKPLGVL